MKERNSKLEEFAASINVTFKDISLLDRALTHRSYINENRHSNKHNERLEFLGDAVLELIVSEFLFIKYPKRPEGELTSFRAATVKTSTLASTSRDLNVGKYLQMSKGEEATGGKDKDYLLANAFESILGSIYIDQGYNSCKKFVSEVLIIKIAEIVEKRLDIDSKTQFQEIAQRNYNTTPTYEVVKEDGPDHDKIFTVNVMVGKKVFGKGSGGSKQRAEDKAATEGLKKLTKDSKSEKIA